MTLPPAFSTGLARVLLALAGTVYLLFGVYCLARTDSAARSLGLAPTGPAGEVELRAVYGGLEIGLGLFFALCSLVPAWNLCGVFCLASTFGALAIVRAVSAFARGVTGSTPWLFLLLEGAFFFLSAIVLWMLWTHAGTGGNAP